MDYTCHYHSPLGGITLASDGDALIGLWFDGQKHYAESIDAEHEDKMLPVLEDACRWLDTYFRGTDPGFTPPLRPRATSFQKQVWDILLTIPFGQTMTYGEIARRLAGMTETVNVARDGDTSFVPSDLPFHIDRESHRTAVHAIPASAPIRTSARAVGGAVGRNPISLIIPCHRVIGADGRLTGYAAGIEKKIRLLKLEQSRVFFAI